MIVVMRHNSAMKGRAGPAHLTTGTKFQAVEGYKGAQDIMLAVERGEVQGVCASIGQFRSWKRSLQLQPDSMPFALITTAASGVRRKSIKAFAAAASAALVIVAAAKTMVFCRSPGSGPTSSMPGSRISSWMRLIPISASPFATRTPAARGSWRVGCG